MDGSVFWHQQDDLSPIYEGPEFEGQSSCIAGGYLPDLQEEAERSVQAALIDDASHILRQVKDHLGFAYFTYFAVRIPGQPRPPEALPFFLSNYPQRWIKRYQERANPRLNPVYVESITRVEPFVWKEETPFTKITREQHHRIDATRNLQTSYGVSVPIHGPGTEFALLIATQSHAGSALNNIPRDKVLELDRIARQVHALVSQRILPRRSIVEKALTSQERRCLELTARGKTSWETSKIIERSEATVNFHLRNAISKLNASNKCNAVAKAIAHSLIDP